MSISLTPAEEASRFLLDLAKGKYNAELAQADQFLASIPLPWAAVARTALDAFVKVNRGTAPSSVQSDGRGGVVPSTNSRINPKTGGFEEA